MKESFLKYLAGVFDADGCISWHFSHGKFADLSIQISNHDTVDLGFHMMKHIHQQTNHGTLCERTQNKSESLMCEWRVYAENSLNMIIPRLLKHLVIKGAHVKRMYDKWLSLRGVTLDASEQESLKDFSRQSRVLAGPVKPKNFPSNHWLAGYLDGDGCFHISKKNNYLMTIHCHINDRCGIDLIHKSYGGKIYSTTTKPHILQYVLNLGPKFRSTALRLLPMLFNICIIKKHKIQQFLQFHQQRLNDKTPTGEAIVQI